jgi:putative ATPase
MKDMGYGEGYKYAHDFPGHFVEQQNLPDTIKDRKFYTPGELGYEKQVDSRLKDWWQKKTKSGEEEIPPEAEAEDV